MIRVMLQRQGKRGMHLSRRVALDQLAIGVGIGVGRVRAVEVEAFRQHRQPRYRRDDIGDLDVVIIDRQREILEDA